MEGVEESYRRQRQTVTLDKEYHVLKGVLYKSGTPPTMLIDVQSKQREWDADAAAAQAPSVDDIRKSFATKTPDNVSPIPTPPVSSTSTVKYGQAAKAKEPALKKGFLEPKVPTVQLPTSSSSSSSPMQPPSPSLGERKITVKAPAATIAGGVKYTLTERGVMSLGYHSCLYILLF
jgi:hypothetical protein